MMISDKQVQQVHRLYGSQSRAKVEKIEKGQEPGAVDRVNLSTRGQEIQLARQSIKATPDIRQDKVESLRSAIKTGTYRVSSGEVADKMLGRLIVDRSLR